MMLTGERLYLPFYVLIYSLDIEVCNIFYRYPISLNMD